MAGAKDREPAGTVPFWAHQLAEMLLGGLLLVEGARTGQHTVVLLGLGSALLLLSLSSDGALGAWPVIGRRLHRILDVVAAVVLALSPLLLSLDGVLAIVILEVAALGMVWLALRTNWTPRRPGRSGRTRRARATPASPLTPVPPSPTSASPQPAAPAEPLARKLGTAVGKARDDGPRQLGRVVGRARNRLRDATSPAPDPPAASPPPPGAPGPPGDGTPPASPPAP
jgi:hypothetical protein